MLHCGRAYTNYITWPPPHGHFVFNKSIVQRWMLHSEASNCPTVGPAAESYLTLGVQRVRRADPQYDGGGLVVNGKSKHACLAICWIHTHSRSADNTEKLEVCVASSNNSFLSITPTDLIKLLQV